MDHISVAKVHCSGPVLDKMVATDETHKDRESNFTPQTLQNCLSQGKAPGKFSVLAFTNRWEQCEGCKCTVCYEAVGRI